MSPVSPRRIAGLGAASLLALSLAASGAPVPAAPPRVSGPYVYENLDVYLIHGQDTGEGRKLTPLARALEQKQVVVSETGQVNQLTVENLSDGPVFVQAGEIVKGGKQDRVLGVDLVLPPRSGKVAIPAHCVEQGRWSTRGTEAADRFESSRAYASDRSLKLANHKGAQSQVWSNVSKLQRQLEGNLGGNVRASQSASSLQLTMENERVRLGVEGYVKALEGLLAAHPDAIGYAFAVDGQISAAEAYGSRALFEELWPKLLRASAVEAVSERKPGSAHQPPTTQAVQAFLAEAEKGAVSERAAGPDARAVARESESSLLVETRETQASHWVHKSYVKK